MGSGVPARTRTHAIVKPRADPWLRELDRQLHADQGHQNRLGWATTEGLQQARGLTRQQAKDALQSENAERLGSFLCEHLLQWVTREHEACGATGASVFASDQERLRAHLFVQAAGGVNRRLWAFAGQSPSRSQRPIQHLHAAIDSAIRLLLDPTAPGRKWRSPSDRQRDRARLSAEVRRPDVTRVLAVAHLTVAGQAEALGVSRTTVTRWWARLVRDGVIGPDDPRLPRPGRPPS